jgi:hypothetical protein
MDLEEAGQKVGKLLEGQVPPQPFTPNWSEFIDSLADPLPPVVQKMGPRTAQPRTRTVYKRAGCMEVQTDCAALEGKPFKSIRQCKADQKKLAAIELIKRKYLSPEKLAKEEG